MNCKYWALVLVLAVIISSSILIGISSQSKGTSPHGESASIYSPTNRQNPQLLNLSPNQWVKLETNNPGWHRQQHAGIAYDSKRGKIYIFGSDTHKSNWDNSVHEFDPITLKWTTHYPSAPKSTYRANEQGVAIAGNELLLPWSMHTFDNILYDPVLDAIIVTAVPGHNKAAKKTAPEATIHPTWIYDLNSHRWHIFDSHGSPNPVFFASASAYDELRNTIVAYRKRQVWEIGPDRKQWKLATKTKQAHHIIHFNMAYDTKRHNFAVFGNHRNTNVVWLYHPGSEAGKEGRWDKRIPAGDPCPEDQHLPVAYDEDNHVFLLVPDNHGYMDLSNGKKKRLKPESASTFVYDPGTNRYTKLPDADIFPLGMNYMMVYDRIHKVFILVTGDWHTPTSVWALKLNIDVLHS